MRPWGAVVSCQAMNKIALLATLAACVDDPELSVEVDEVVAANFVVQRGPACTTAQLSDAALTQFRSVLVGDLLPRARTVANSPAFRECLRTTMASPRALRFNGTLGQYGPLLNASGETGLFATSGLPVDRIRDVYAARIALEATSPHQTILTCSTLEGYAGWSDGPSWLSSGDFAAREEINIHFSLMGQDHSNLPANRQRRSFMAGLIWHEVMHERNYWHADATYDRHIPPIVGACMDQVFSDTEATCGLTACPSGFNALYPFLAGQVGDPGSCTCVRDPGTAHAPTLVDSWSWKGLSKVAIDATGQAWALASRNLYKRDGHTWTLVGPALDIVAGGDAVAVKLAATVDQPEGWSLRSRIGTADFTPSVPNETMAIDGFGRLLRLVNGQLSRRKGSGPWSALGPATSFATNSDLVYRILDGVASRLDASPNPTWTSLGGLDGAITVDAYGTLFDLASNQTLWRHRGTSWEQIGGPDDQIGADASFFTHSPVDGWVYRRATDNGWYRVAQCTSFVTGGRSLLCRRGVALELYDF